MFGTGFDEWEAAPLLRMAGAVLLAAVAVKLMDDTLDRERDRAAGRPNWAEGLGGSAPLYALAALAVGVLLQAPVAGSLFLSAYALGMLWGGEGAAACQPSGLRGWQESLLAVLVGAAAAGPREMAASLALIFALQVADDLWDARNGVPKACSALLLRWSRTESFLAGAAAGLAGIFLDPAKAILALSIGGALIFWTGRIKG